MIHELPVLREVFEGAAALTADSRAAAGREPTARRTWESAAECRLEFCRSLPPATDRKG